MMPCLTPLRIYKVLKRMDGSKTDQQSLTPLRIYKVLKHLIALCAHHHGLTPLRIYKVLKLTAFNHNLPPA